MVSELVRTTMLYTHPHIICTILYGIYTLCGIVDTAGFYRSVCLACMLSYVDLLSRQRIVYTSRRTTGSDSQHQADEKGWMLDAGRHHSYERDVERSVFER